MHGTGDYVSKNELFGKKAGLPLNFLTELFLPINGLEKIIRNEPKKLKNILKTNLRK